MPKGKKKTELKETKISEINNSNIMRNATSQIYLDLRYLYYMLLEGGLTSLKNVH